MTSNEYIQNIIDLRGQWSDEVRYSSRGCCRHHIIPKCKGGEPKTLTWEHHMNVIWLYPSEHYEIHKLLYEECTDPHDDLVFAFYYMTKTLNITSLSGEEYEKLLEDAREYNRFSKSHPSDETRDKLSKCKMGDNNPSKHWSDDIRKKESELRTALNKARSKDEYHRIALKGAETRKQNGINFCSGNNPAARKVRCIETGEIFECVKDAATKYGGAIGAVCSGKRKRAGGHTWEYVF